MKTGLYTLVTSDYHQLEYWTIETKAKPNFKTKGYNLIPEIHEPIIRGINKCVGVRIHFNSFGKIIEVEKYETMNKI